MSFACLMSEACWWFTESSNLLFSLQLPSKFLSQIPVSRSSCPYPSCTLLPWTMPEMAGLCLTLAASWLLAQPQPWLAWRCRLPAEPVSLLRPCWAGPSWQGPCCPGTLPASLPFREQLAGAVPWLPARPALRWHQAAQPVAVQGLPRQTPWALVSHHPPELLVGPSPSCGLSWWCVCPQGQLDPFQPLLGSLVTSPPTSSAVPLPSAAAAGSIPHRAHGRSAAVALLHSKVLHLAPDRRKGDEYAKEGRMLSGFWASTKSDGSEQPHWGSGPSWNGASVPSAPAWHAALQLSPCAWPVFGLTCCDIDWGAGWGWLW